jgi:EAL domain-containing protein (putative c-di-GMP-specific phosphodiesterase class I)
MEQVGEMGVRMLIGDFGTGYPSLSYVQNLPIDASKIDRSFVEELTGTSHGATDVAQAIIAMAHSPKITVVAEGVETGEQLETLASLDCDLAQGFLLHYPMPVEQVQMVLRRQRVAGKIEAPAEGVREGR